MNAIQKASTYMRFSLFLLFWMRNCFVFILLFSLFLGSNKWSWTGNGCLQDSMLHRASCIPLECIWPYGMPCHSFLPLHSSFHLFFRHKINFIQKQFFDIIRKNAIIMSKVNKGVSTQNPIITRDSFREYEHSNNSNNKFFCS